MRSYYYVVFQLELCFGIALDWFEIHDERVLHGEDCVTLEMLINAIEYLSRDWLILVMCHLNLLMAVCKIPNSYNEVYMCWSHWVSVQKLEKPSSRP